MKITKTQLKRLIKEELGKVLREATGIRPDQPMSIGWEEDAEWEPATPEEIARSDQPVPPEWPEDPEPEYGEDLVAEDLDALGNPLEMDESANYYIVNSSGGFVSGYTTGNPKFVYSHDWPTIPIPPAKAKGFGLSSAGAFRSKYETQTGQKLKLLKVEE